MADKHLVNPPSAGRPPRLARLTASALSIPEYRDDVLGDLHEGYLALARQSPMAARSWYWCQVLRSLPSLLARRIQSVGVARWSVLALACVSAVIAISAWDIWIARRAAYLWATQPDAPSLLLIRGLYFLVFTIGAAVAGALAALIGFHPQKSFRSNTLGVLLPVLLLATAFMTLSLAASSTENWLPYLLLRTVLIAPALALGACIAMRLRST